MQIALLNNNIVYADEALYEYGKDKDYICPCCNEQLILKTGTIKIPHFSHFQDSNCYDDIKNDMSDWHIYCQSLFPKEYREVIIIKKLKDLYHDYKGEEKETHIADICYKNYVIEFQHSPMSPDLFDTRTQFYLRAGYKLIWVFDWNEIFNRMEDIGSTDDGYKWSIKNPPKTCMYYFPQEYKKNLMICISNDCEDSNSSDLSYLEQIVWARPNKNNKELADYSRIVTKDLDSIERLAKYILSK